MGSHHRASPLPPDDRRRTIIEAVTPLLVERGAAVTSREMATAAGIAEGTIFRVFPDKRSIIIEAIKTTMDPAPMQAALAGIPQTDPLDVQLEKAAEVLLDRITRGAALVGALHSMPAQDHPKPRRTKRLINESNAVILGSLTALFERHGDDLRVPPSRAAATLRDLIFVAGHPMLAGDKQLQPAEIVDVLLNGVLASGED